MDGVTHQEAAVPVDGVTHHEAAVPVDGVAHHEAAVPVDGVAHHAGCSAGEAGSMDVQLDVVQLPHPTVMQPVSMALDGASVEEAHDGWMGGGRSCSLQLPAEVEAWLGLIGQ